MWTTRAALLWATWPVAGLFTHNRPAAPTAPWWQTTRTRCWSWVLQQLERTKFAWIWRIGSAWPMWWWCFARHVLLPWAWSARRILAAPGRHWSCLLRTAAPPSGSLMTLTSRRRSAHPDTPAPHRVQQERRVVWLISLVAVIVSCGFPLDQTSRHTEEQKQRHAKKFTYVIVDPPQVIFRSMARGRGMDDPYSPEALSLLIMTNLRIRLLKPHHCPASPFTSSRGQRNAPRQASDRRFFPKPLRRSSHNHTHSDFSPYTILMLLAGGTCLCHGHAEQCLPSAGRAGLQSSGTVSLVWK